MTPGPVVEQAKASVVFPGAANLGKTGNVGSPLSNADRSKKSSISFAFASLNVIAGKFHFRSRNASTEV